VQHIAGDAPGGHGVTGSAQRSAREQTGLADKPPVVLSRRFSIGLGPGKAGTAGAALRTATPETVYYDGGVSAVFGHRNSAGKWIFYGVLMDSRGGGGSGLVNLVTQQHVMQRGDQGENARQSR
jgi:hypothetical protein